MAGKTHKNQRNRWDDLVRFLCFLVLSTAGMSAIGMSLLAEPLKVYYADRAFIRAQQRQIAQMEEQLRQQEELLANTDNPSVVERAAVSNFKYTPLPEKDRPSLNLPEEWPDLKEALAQVGQAPAEEPAAAWLKYAEKIADLPDQQMLLMGLGAALVIIALTCFYRLR